MVNFVSMIIALSALGCVISLSETDFLCPAAKGQFADPENCTAYYNCWDFAWTKQYCQEGLYFDAQIERCNWKNAVHCNVSLKSPEVTASSKSSHVDKVAALLDLGYSNHVTSVCRSTSQYPNPCLRPDGPSPDPKNCSHYYDCWKCDYVDRYCPIGVYYDSSTYQCSSYSSTACGTAAGRAYPEIAATVPEYVATGPAVPSSGSGGGAPTATYLPEASSVPKNGYPNTNSGYPQNVVPAIQGSYPVNQYENPASTGVAAPGVVQSLPPANGPSNGIPAAVPGYGPGGSGSNVVGQNPYGGNAAPTVATTGPAYTATVAPGNSYIQVGAVPVAPAGYIPVLPAVSNPYAPPSPTTSYQVPAAVPGDYGGNSGNNITGPNRYGKSDILATIATTLPPFTATVAPGNSYNQGGSVPVSSTDYAPVVPVVSNPYAPTAPAPNYQVPVAAAPGPNLPKPNVSPVTYPPQPTYATLAYLPTLPTLPPPATSGYGTQTVTLPSTAKPNVYANDNGANDIGTTAPMTFRPFDPYATFAPFAEYSTIPALFPWSQTGLTNGPASGHEQATPSYTGGDDSARKIPPAYPSPAVVAERGYASPSVPSPDANPQVTSIQHPDSGTTVYVTNNILTTILVTNRTQNSTAAPQVGYLKLQPLRESSPCPDSKGGVIADRNDCRAYITCLNGGGWTRTYCPDGSGFDEKKKICGTSWDSVRGCRMKGPDSTQKRKPSGRDNSQENFGSSELEREVISNPQYSHPLFFSPQESAPTSISTIPQPQTTVAHHQPDKDQQKSGGYVQQSQLVLKPFRSKRHVNNELDNKDFACPEEQGLYPHEKDCSLFWSCGDGQLGFLQSCPDGPEPLFFNFTKQQCDWARGAKCVQGKVVVSPNHQTPHPHIAPTTKKPIPEDHHEEGNFNCPSNEGIFGHPFNCAKYYHCRDWNPKLLVCQPGHLYNRNKRICEHEKFVVCPHGNVRPKIDKFPCPAKDGYFPDPLTCRRFYRCVNYRSYHLLCPENLLWSESKKVCDWPQEVACGAAFLHPVHFKCPLPNGKFNHPIKDDEFYECLHGVPRRQFCPRDHTFIANLRRCLSNKMLVTESSVVTGTSTTVASTTAFHKTTEATTSTPKEVPSSVTPSSPVEITQSTTTSGPSTDRPSSTAASSTTLLSTTDYSITNTMGTSNTTLAEVSTSTQAHIITIDVVTEVTINGSTGASNVPSTEVSTATQSNTHDVDARTSSAVTGTTAESSTASTEHSLSTKSHPDTTVAATEGTASGSTETSNATSTEVSPTTSSHPNGSDSAKDGGFSNNTATSNTASTEHLPSTKSHPDSNGATTESPVIVDTGASTVVSTEVSTSIQSHTNNTDITSSPVSSSTAASDTASTEHSTSTQFHTSAGEVTAKSPVTSSTRISSPTEQSTRTDFHNDTEKAITESPGTKRSVVNSPSSTEPSTSTHFHVKVVDISTDIPVSSSTAVGSTNATEHSKTEQENAMEVATGTTDASSTPTSTITSSEQTSAQHHRGVTTEIPTSSSTSMSSSTFAADSMSTEVQTNSSVTKHPDDSISNGRTKSPDHSTDFLPIITTESSSHGPSTSSTPLFSTQDPTPVVSHHTSTDHSTTTHHSPNSTEPAHDITTSPVTIEPKNLAPGSNNTTATSTAPAVPRANVTDATNTTTSVMPEGVVASETTVAPTTTSISLITEISSLEITATLSTVSIGTTVRSAAVDLNDTTPSSIDEHDATTITTSPIEDKGKEDRTNKQDKINEDRDETTHTHPTSTQQSSEYDVSEPTTDRSSTANIDTTSVATITEPFTWILPLENSAVATYGSSSINPEHPTGNPDDHITAITRDLATTEVSVTTTHNKNAEADHIGHTEVTTVATKAENHNFTETNLGAATYNGTESSGIHTISGQPIDTLNSSATINVTVSNRTEHSSINETSTVPQTGTTGSGNESISSGNSSASVPEDRDSKRIAVGGQSEIQRNFTDTRDVTTANVTETFRAITTPVFEADDKPYYPRRSDSNPIATITPILPVKPITTSWIPIVPIDSKGDGGFVIERESASQEKISIPRYRIKNVSE